MTSLAAEGAENATVTAAKEAMLGHLEDLFEVSMTPGEIPQSIRSTLETRTS